MRRRKLTPQQWRQVIEQYEASGMEQKAFAKKVGVSWSALQYWLYKFRRERGEGKRSYQRSSTPEKPISFVEVKAPSAQLHRSIEVDLPSGIRVRFDAATDAAMIGAVTHALSRC